MPTTTQQRAVYNRHPTSLYDFRVSFFNPTIWLDEFSDFFQDSAGTTPATAASDPVGRWSDRSGNDFHATSSNANRPVLASSGGVLVPDMDGTDDHLVIANDAGFAQLEVWTIAMRLNPDSTAAQRLWGYEGALVPYRCSMGSNGSLIIQVDGATTDASAGTLAGTAPTPGVDSWLFCTFDNNDGRKAKLWNPYHLSESEVAMEGDIVFPTSDLFLGNTEAGGTASPFGGLYRAFIVFPSVLAPVNMRWIMNGAA